MSIIFPGLYEMLLLGSFALGLVLFVTGIVLLIKVKNKIAGAVTTAIGLVFTVLPLGVLLFLTVYTSVRGGM